MTDTPTNADSPHLHHDEGALLAIATRAVAMAETLGLSASASVSESGGLSVSARDGQVEVRTGDQSQRLTVTVHDGARQGHASTGRFDAAAIAAVVDRARALAQFGGEDPLRALPSPDMVARDPCRVPLFRTSGWSSNDLAAHAVAIEAAALAEGARLGIRMVVDGAAVDAHDHRVALVASNGFAGVYSGSSSSRNCSVAAGDEGNRRLAGRSSNQRDMTRLLDPETIGCEATARAARQLNPRAITTRRAPILFENFVARDLIASLLGALSGGAQMNGGTFLPQAIDTAVCADHVTVHEDPYIAFGAASAPFDAEGIAGLQRDIVADGVATGYLLGTYSGRRLGMASTGNASGPYNLRIDSRLTDPADDAAAMLRKLGTGLYVTSVSNQGVNMFTGDYSRAATGFWIEDGDIAFPVEGVTLVGNLKTMLAGIAAIGADRVEDGAMACGSILIDAMDIAGA